MAQYTEISVGNNLEIDNNVSYFRYIVNHVGGELLLQERIGESTWNTIESKTGGGLGVFRVGVRDQNWVLDEELTGTGFSGTEGVDWINIEKHKLS